MSRAIVVAFRFTACRSSPAILACAHVVLTKAMGAAIDWANRIFANTEANCSRHLAPTGSTEAFPLHTHAMGSAIDGIVRRPIVTMLIFTDLSKPFAFAFTSTDCSVPVPMRRIASGVQLDDIALLLLFDNCLLPRCLIHYSFRFFDIAAAVISNSSCCSWRRYIILATM